MSRLLQFAAGLAFATAAVLPTTVLASDPTDVIDYRKHIMKTLGEQVAAMNMTLQEKAPAENFVAHVETLAVTATQALKSFEPDVAGGASKPEVWTKWDDFSKRMNEMVANTADLAKTAKAGGAAAAQPKLQAALTCKGCHDLYREPKK
jgi:cytochrome c556